MTTARATTRPEQASVLVSRLVTLRRVLRHPALGRVRSDCGFPVPGRAKIPSAWRSLCTGAGMGMASECDVTVECNVTAEAALIGVLATTTCTGEERRTIHCTRASCVLRLPADFHPITSYTLCGAHLALGVQSRNCIPSSSDASLISHLSSRAPRTRTRLSHSQPNCSAHSEISHPISSIFKLDARDIPIPSSYPGRARFIFPLLNLGAAAYY